MIKRFIALLLCALLLGSAAGSLAEGTSPFSFTPEELTLHAFVGNMFEEHAKRHDMAIGSYSLADGTDVIMSFPQGSSYSVLSCLEYEDNMVRKMARKDTEINDLFLPMFIVAQTASLQPDLNFPLNIEKFEGKYSRNIFFGSAQTSWWQAATNEIDGTTLLVVPVYLMDAKKNIIDDMLYVMCITYRPDGTDVWLCSDSYLVYTIVSAVKPPKAHEQDEVKIWWDGQEDYRQAVLEDPESEAAYRLAYADAMNQVFHGE